MNTEDYLKIAVGVLVVIVFLLGFKLRREMKKVCPVVVCPTVQCPDCKCPVTVAPAVTSAVTAPVAPESPVAPVAPVAPSTSP